MNFSKIQQFIRDELNPFLWNKRIVLFIVLFLFVFNQAEKYFTRGDNNDAWEYIVSMDGRGYYAYLPALLIYGDPTYSFYPVQNPVDEKEVNFVNVVEDNKIVNKYFSGEAVLLAPFFSIAHLTAKLGGLNASGYTEIYYWSVLMASLFYGIVGLWILHLFLFKLTQNKTGSILIPFVIFFGSNLYYYTIYEPSMSHVYSFFLVTLFLHLSLFIADNLSRPWWTILFGLVFGLIVLVRPSNGVIIFTFLFAFQSFSHFYKSVFAKVNIFSFVSFFFGFSIIISIQLSLYKWQTGNWLVWSYQHEGFDFLNPNIFNSLFSYQKGFFLYVPVCFLSLIGIYSLYKVSSYKAIVISGILLISIYVVSSWHAWGYGWGFSIRAYVEYLPLYAILLMYLSRNQKSQIYIFSVMVILTFFTMRKTTQLVDGKLPKEGITQSQFFNNLL